MENPRPAGAIIRQDLGIRMPASLPKAPRAFRGVILRSVQDDRQDILSRVRGISSHGPRALEVDIYAAVIYMIDRVSGPVRLCPCRPLPAAPLTVRSHDCLRS